MIAEEDHDKATLGAIGEGMHTLVSSFNHGRDDLGALEEMPLAAVLFLATIGTPGERALMDSPLLLVLRSIHDTIEGWGKAVPKAEIDRLGYRVGLAIELAKRGGTVPVEDIGREQAQREREQAQHEHGQGKHEAPPKGPKKTAKKKPRRAKP